NDYEDEGSIHIEDWRKSIHEARVLEECSEASDEDNYCKDLPTHQAAIAEDMVDRVTLGRTKAKRRIQRKIKEESQVAVEVFDVGRSEFQDGDLVANWDLVDSGDISIDTGDISGAIPMEKTNQQK
ncbi:hypothetical protein U1Q18_036079, partial [Sarracenia purpurea var. burkii]